MMHHHDEHITIPLSILAGTATWIADPNVWRALAVAAACGFVGGVAKAAGFWVWHKVRERRNKATKK